MGTHNYPCIFLSLYPSLLNITISTPINDIPVHREYPINVETHIHIYSTRKRSVAVTRNAKILHFPKLPVTLRHRRQHGMGVLREYDLCCVSCLRENYRNDE